MKGLKNYRTFIIYQEFCDYDFVVESSNILGEKLDLKNPYGIFNRLFCEHLYSFVKSKLNNVVNHNDGNNLLLKNYYLYVFNTCHALPYVSFTKIFFGG